MIKENLREVEREIELACKKAGRDQSEVTLVAVSKTKPVEMLKEAYEAGIRDFGENRVQELVSKYEALPKDIRWHMIGHLQTNKVTAVIGKAYLIHSINSIKLLEAIEPEAEKLDIVVRGLLEVNVAREESKFGFLPEELPSDAENFTKYPHVKICGLMTVAPNVEDGQENRAVFSKLKELSVDIENKTNHNITMEYLSMGMSGDYPVAIEEGATFVRVGTKIFGGR